MMALRSASVLSGGFILKLVSYSRRDWSVSAMWWGVASAVTRTPSAFARLRISTESADETCCMWMWAPV